MKRLIILIALILIVNVSYSQILPKERQTQRTISTKGWIKKITPSNRTLIDAGLYTGMFSAFGVALYGADKKSKPMYKLAAILGGATVTLQIFNMTLSTETKTSSYNRVTRNKY